MHLDGGARDLQAFWRRSARLAQAAGLGGAAVLLLAAPDGPAAALGLLLGTAVGVLRFRVRYRSLAHLQAVGPLVRSRLIAYALSALALALAFGFPETFRPWSTVIGLLVMNASVVATELLWTRRPPERAGAAPEGGP